MIIRKWQFKFFFTMEIIEIVRYYLKKVPKQLQFLSVKYKPVLPE